MAQKTIKNIGRLSERTVTLNTTEITRLIGDNKKVVTAILKLNNATISAESSVASNCGCATGKEIDRILFCTNKTVCINVTHEIDCVLKNSLQQIDFTFSGGLTCGNIDLEIEYLPQQIMHQNNAYLDIDVNGAGSGKINLASGNVRFASAGLVYNGYQAGKQTVVIDDAKDGKQQFATHCGKGWKLGIEQFLVKRAGEDGQDVYTYIDGDGNYHEFTEKFYYKDDNNNKIYINKSSVNVDLNGKLTYDGYEIKTERRSTSGLVLETDYNGFKGSHLLEQRQDEQIELEENVEAYENQLKQYVVIKKDNGDTVCTLKKADNTLGDVEEFISDCTDDRLMLTESEAVQYNSLLLQFTSNEKTLSGKTINQSKYNPYEDYSVQLTDNAKSFMISGYDNKLANLRLLVKHLRKDYAKLTKKCNYAPLGSNPIYQYEEYYKFKKNCVDIKKCLLDIIGIGQYKANTSIKNLSQNPNGTTSNPKYLHLVDNVCDLEEELQVINDDLEMYYRATEYDSLTNGMTDDEKNNAESWKYKERETLLKEKENKMKISQLIYQFQKNFSGRVDKLQQNISDFETEINDFVEEEQRKLVNWQITILIDRSIQNKTDLQKYYKQYINKKHQLEQLYLQLPVNYITSGDSVMGFNKYGQFVATFDAYENQTAIIYEDGKIVSVKDTDNNETSFQYNADGLLCKIVSADEKTTQFDYNSGLLTKITYSNGETAEFSYCMGTDHTLHDGLAFKNFELESVTDSFGLGVRFVYDEFGRITEVKEFTNTYSVSCEKLLKESDVKYKTFAKMEYKSEKATTITDANGVLTTYVFDLIGNPVTVYEGEYADPEETTKAVSLTYTDGKQSFSIKENLAYPNLLALQNADNTLNTAKNERVLTYCLSRQQLPKNVANFVFTAWARADSSYIKDSQKIQYAPNTSANDALLDTYQTNRKFGLKAKVNYESGEPDVYCASFDWLNTDWQFLALPVEICADDTTGDKLPTAFDFKVGGNPRAVTNIELSVDYSYNTGNIEVDCISLRQGDWTKSTFDANGRKLTDEDSQTKSVTEYFYDDNDRVTKQVLTDRQYRKFTSTFEYNKQNSLVRSTNFAGVVEETVFDEKGRELKKITYNVDDPTSKFYQESKRDDKGVITADVDESGKYDSVKYTYDHNNEAIVHTDGKGNKTAFGYKDGNLVSISGSADGQESTNTMKYTADLLTKVSNGDTSYSYEYDGWGRTKKVEIADVTYAETEYVSDFETKTVLAGTIESATVADKYGNVRQQTTVFDNGATETVTNNYDDLQNLQSVNIDTENGNGYNITYTRDKDKIVSEVRSGEYPLEKTFGYNADGDVENTTYKVADRELKYSYETDHTPDKRNSKVSLPFGVEQNFAYDGLGRTKEISLTGNLVKDIYYAKYGDHATNRVNSVWHGINGIRKDNTKYTYDKAGNISTVTENGIEIAKYVYDGLNRLIRENNSTFGKITYEYDNAGNILCKAVDGKRYKYTYSQNGWKDQLLERSYKEYDGTTVHEYFKYDVIGNPVVYRNRTLSWQGRRLLRYGNNEYYAEYTYDVNGVRTSKHAVTPIGITDTKYIYDGNNLVAEQRNNEWIYYIYGVDGIAGFNYQGNTYLYRKNVQGDVTHIYKQLSDNTLEQVAHYVYDAWGNCEILQNVNNVATLNPFRYRSYYFDEETGLYYLQTRYYDPELCRFISADSIEYLDPETLGGLNLYVYCGNNPVIGYDPNGTFDWDKFWRTLGTIAVAAVVLAITVAVCIATVGTAAPVLIGAGVGFAMGMAGSAITQAIFTGTVDVGKMFLDGFVGAISGAVAVTGIGFWGSVAFGGFISGVASIGEDVIDGEGIDGGKLLLSIGLGMIGGAISGSGINAKEVMSKTKYFNSVLKTAVSPKKISMYTAKQTLLKRNTIIGVVRFISSILTGHFASKGLGKLFES